MSLEDLTQHTHDQLFVITAQKNARCFDNSGTVDLTDWIAFRDSVWGEELTSLGTRELASLEAQGLESWMARGLASLEMEDLAERDDEPLPDVTPATSSVVQIPETMPSVWDLDSRYILVRSEYEEAERAAVSENARNSTAFLVTGQPGIGKTVFLVWLLMRRLSLRLPTVLQYESGKVMLFHEGGVSRFRNLDDTLSVMGLKFPRHSPARIWVLVDSNDRLIEPAPIFRTRGPFFVVVATSPRQPHLRWPKKVPSRRFYMKTWTFSEVLKARPFMGLSSAGPYTSHQLWYLYNTYGASPGTLTSYSHKPAAYRDRVVRGIQGISPESLLCILRRPESDKSSHLFVAIEPSPNSRNIHEVRFVSRHVFEMLWDRLIKRQVFELQFYYELSSPSSAGWIFKSRVHELLRRGDSIPLFLVRGRVAETEFIFDDYTASKEKKPHRIFQLPESEEYFLDEPTHPGVGRYCRTRPANFATIDALFFVRPPGEPSPTFFALQFARVEERDVKENELRRIIQLGHSWTPDIETRAYFVVVTPDDVQPKITVPKTSFGDKGGKVTGEESLDRLFRVFHFPISRKKLFPSRNYD